jgi:hypothetical protein
MENFAIVLMEENDQQWKFFTDINSPATQEEYENANFFRN